MTLFLRTKHALEQAEEWIEAKAQEIDELSAGGEEAVESLFNAIRKSRQGLEHE